MPGFGGFVVLLVLGVVFFSAALTAWLTLCVAATGEIVEASLPTPRKIVWAASVWLVPLAGVAVWQLSRGRRAPHSSAA